MAGLALVAPLSGRIVGAAARASPLLLAGACARRAASAHRPDRPPRSALLLGAYALFGLGFGLVNPPITNTAVSGMPDSQAGVAAAVASTSRQVGQSLGVAVIGSILGTAAGSAAGRAGRGQPPGLVDDRRLRRAGARARRAPRPPGRGTAARVAAEGARPPSSSRSTA